MTKKLFYITSEMDPFASVSPLSDLSVKVPLGLQELGNDVRCLMPKYGFISERKYILREVIRLKEILFNFDDMDYACSAKSAFLPKSRLQVYFLEHEEIFGDLNNLLYKAKNGRFLNDNDKRFAFYALAAIKMLPNLFWYPNVIICSGWTSALIPMLVKTLAKNDKDLSKIKTVYIASSINKDISFDPTNLGFNKETFSPLKALNLNQIGCKYADKTIVVNGSENISSNLMKLKVFKDAKNCSIVNLDHGEETDYSPLLDAIEQGIKKI
jgi:starch synthase